MYTLMRLTKLFYLKGINEDMNSIINQQFRIDFNVPLLLEAKIGDNWLDTKDVADITMKHLTF